MSPFDLLTPGQWLVLASFIAVLTCAKPMRATAIWFASLFATNYIWLDWTAKNLDAGYYGFHLLRIAAELVIICALIRQANKLARWLIWLEVAMIATCLLALAAPHSDLLRAAYPYKKATILALESLQVFGVFFFAFPIYRHLYGQPAKKDQHTWLARSMTQRHI